MKVVRISNITHPTLCWKLRADATLPKERCTYRKRHAGPCQFDVEGAAGRSARAKRIRGAKGTP